MAPTAVDLAHFRSVQPELSAEQVRAAIASYFVEDDNHDLAATNARATKERSGASPSGASSNGAGASGTTGASLTALPETDANGNV